MKVTMTSFKKILETYETYGILWGWDKGGEVGGSQCYASESHVEQLPSRKINSNPWSPGSSTEGPFPALPLLSDKPGSDLEEATLAQGT